MLYFFLLHPQLGKMNYDFVANQKFCKVSSRTLENWMKYRDSILSGILPMVKELATGVVLQSLGISTIASNIELDSQVNVELFLQKNPIQNQTLCNKPH